MCQLHARRINQTSCAAVPARITPPPGSVTGVGLEITYDGGSGKDVVVLTPAPGGPAEKAGARAGDVIVTVDGTAVKGLSLYDVSDLLQGEADSQVTCLAQWQLLTMRCVALLAVHLLYLTAYTILCLLRALRGRTCLTRMAPVVCCCAEALCCVIVALRVRRWRWCCMRLEHPATRAACN